MIDNHLNLSFFKGTEISDDDVEFDILNALKKEKSIQKILMNHTEWQFLYNLSPIRENLLEWYDFDCESSVLEIGSGCGSITGLLCKKAKRVVCIEASKRRSDINITKNGQFDNFEIIVGNFDDIVINEKFDYVTMIGSFECAPNFISGIDPYRKVLDRVKELLKPNGKLIIAIDNKYGMKYWSGVAEPITGILFEGIEDYKNTNGNKTFSYSEFKHILMAAGFTRCQFYFPVPDYILPSEIYSENNLPKSGSLVNISSEYKSERYQLFDEEKAFNGICSDGRFVEFANSFLVISEC